jgi:hypothetical protein
VSQSTTPHSCDRAVLIQQDGELSEFADLLSELAVPVDECSAGFPDREQLKGAGIVIISGEMFLESGTPDLSLWPRTIAVVDDSSRTLVAHLNRIGVAMVIRRPIHPRALRLLLLHEIYRGPERRGRRRILIGHPIRISSGLFRTQATLLELSPAGARIELASALKVGSKIRILIGKELTKNKAVQFQAKVIRAIPASDKKNRAKSEIAVSILDATRHAKTIKAILDRFALGPAKWKTTRRKAVAESHRAASASHVETTDSGISRSLSPTHAPFTQSIAEPEIDDPQIDATAAHESTAPTSEVETLTTDPVIPDGLDSHASKPYDEAVSDDLSERRSDRRIPYDQRVVALGEEAARVLVGRDLCGGGMRIAATPSVAVGDALRVALHSGTETEPLVVLANAIRDDGDDGLVLSFDEMSESQREQLAAIIDSGDLETSSAMGEEIVIAEVLETTGSEGDAEIDAHLESVFDTSESLKDAR